MRGQIRQLMRGEFLASTANIRLIGRPGASKSHVMAELARGLVEHGHPDLFIPVARLVERLLDAKRDLRLTRELAEVSTRVGCVAHPATVNEATDAHRIAARHSTVISTSRAKSHSWDN